MSHDATNNDIVRQVYWNLCRGAPSTVAPKRGRCPICQVPELWMVYERKRDLLKDHPRCFGIAHQSKHNGSDTLLARRSGKGSAPREGRVNREQTLGHKRSRTPSVTATVADVV